MIKDMKTRISKLNIDFDFEAYWEIIYLILLTFFVGMRFLLSTMFTIYWPKYFYRTLTVIGVVLVLLHLMMAKDISKKEIAAMLVVTFVFMMSHYVSGYDFLVDLLILILGAYRVNFRNILKTYIAVWSVLLVVTIIGAMTGLAENLVYYQWQYGKDDRVRMALGICYPTDLAAYVAFLLFAYVCIRNKYITYLEIGGMILLTLAVYYITDARTDFLIMLLTVFIAIVLTIIRKYKITVDNLFFRFVMSMFPVMICGGSWLATLGFNGECIFLNKMNNGILSNRLSLGKQAIDDYGISLFGHYVYEKGFGGSTDSVDSYFFIDCSYISIAIKYGIILMILIVLINIKIIRYGIKNNMDSIYMVIGCICIQSIMEHHMIQYWYNPFVLCFFCNMTLENVHNKKIKSCIEDLN